MRKVLQITGLLLISGSLALKSQEKVQPCDTYKAMNEYFSTNPQAKAEYEARQAEMQAQYQAYLQEKTTGKTAAFQYTIPVVFHVLHLGGSENVSDAAIINLLDNVNKDFAKQGSDIGSISPLFSGLYVDSEIKLMLAHKDPNGNCTSGITRHYDTKTNWDRSSATNFGINNYVYTWNPTKYLNIYLVKNIISTSGGSGVVVGYTYKPGTWSSGAAPDAIVFNAGWIGSSPRSMSHEIGHWLNLSHTFGNTNDPGQTCDDDGISDTPPTKGYYSTCPSSSGGNTCHSSGNANVENIMDYSSCPKMFTQGQTNAMRSALASGTSGRSNLSSAGNLTATDVNGTSLCGPIADLYPATFTVCTGSSVNFYDASYNGTVTSRSWAASGNATIANPTAAVTGIIFGTPGVQTVSLTVSNSSGTHTATRNINVLDGTPDYGFYTYMESFESGGLPPKFTVINQTGGTTWKSSTWPATGNFAYYIDNTINPNNAIDILETPSYDFLNSPGATFTFKYAYARKTSTHNDVFKVQATKNCGGTWEDIYTPTASFLASGSGGTTTTPFFPTPEQYKTYTVTTHPFFGSYKNSSNVKIRFYFQEDGTSGFGNNIFLDDINFESPAGINELTKSIGFNVYPNPASGNAVIEFTLSDNAFIKYHITDITGRVVEQEKTLNLFPGTHELNINQNRKLSTGVYFVNFDINNQRISRKLIIE